MQLQKVELTLTAQDGQVCGSSYKDIGIQSENESYFITRKKEKLIHKGNLLQSYDIMHFKKVKCN